MKSNFRPALAAAMVLALAAPAAAQPALKTPFPLSDQLARVMWCSAVFFEESYHWDDDREVGQWYDDLSLALEEQAEGLLEDEGWSWDEVDELWAAFDNTAEDLLVEDEPAYFAELEGCEQSYGGLMPHPMS